MGALDDIREIITHDLDADFIKSLSIAVAWEYSQLYDSLADDEALTDDFRLEEFARRRTSCVVRTVARVAKAFGIPFDFRRLECNGQSKILVKAGRVVLIQEPIVMLEDGPRASEYKIELAESHGLIRQLELDLGDQPHRIRDWSGCILAVLLHGASGRHFTRDHRTLGSLMLGVPDAGYNYWVMRLDLMRVAMFGFEDLSDEEPSESHSTQRDEVHITLRENKKREDNRE